MTLGPAVGLVAQMLGKPLMEWQQYVADVLGEIDPVTGELAWDEYTLTVPRQSGKSILILAKAVHRCSATGFFGRGQWIAYAAQTKAKASEKFEQDYALALKAARQIKARSRVGNTKVDVRFPNGSVFGVEGGTEKAGHGSVLDEAFIDEAFAQPDNRLEQAFGPAMITRRNKQLGVVSTMGWSDASPYFMARVRVGRALVGEGVRSGAAYFEWSAPEDADPGDEDVWLGCMPALHRPECGSRCRAHTVRIPTIRSEFEKARRAGRLADFRRSYLNQSVRKPREGEETILGNWLACGMTVRVGELPPPVAIGVALSVGREAACIGSAGVLPGGRVLVAPVDSRAGVDWVAGEAARISRVWDVPVVVNSSGPAVEKVAGGVEEAGGRVIRMGSADYVAACADMFDRVHAGSVAHTGDMELNASVAGARWRSMGDGNQVFGRRASESDVMLLEAVTGALWGVGSGYDLLDSVL